MKRRGGTAGAPAAWGRRQGARGEATARQAGTLQSGVCPGVGSGGRGAEGGGGRC